MEWYLSDEKFIFLTGRGGIGKSTIVRKFIMENDEHFENMIYLKYKETIQETISDDVRFCINGCERDDNESMEEYCDEYEEFREYEASNENYFWDDEF